MSPLATLTQILGLSLVAGVNLYASVLVVGLGIRYGWFGNLPAELSVLAHPVVLILAGALYLVEFFADKIPFITPVWDAIHTFIRPLGAAALAVGAAGDLRPEWQVAAALAGGAIGLGSHTTKMGARLLAHAAPEPTSHSIISLLEDAGVVGLIILAYQYPWAALLVILILLAIMAALLPVLIRICRFLLAGTGGWLFGWLVGEEPPPVPRLLVASIQKAAPAGGERVYECFARAVRGAPRLKHGCLVVAGERHFFICGKLAGARMIELGGASEESARHYDGVIFDVLSVSGESGVSGSVYLTKPSSRRYLHDRARTGPGAAYPAAQSGRMPES